MSAQRLQPNHIRIQPWQQCILASYAIFFAFVLPLMCWGAAATPGHPHKHAHFVFSIPDVVEPTTAQPHVHFPQYIDGQWVFEASHEHGQSDTGLPFRAEPDLTLISILLLLLAVTTRVAFRPLSLFSRKLIHLLPDSLIHTPASPPPEVCFSPS